MAFTRPDNNKSLWRLKPDVIQGQSATVKADLDKLLNMNTDDLIALMTALEATTGAANIGADGGTVQEILDLKANKTYVDGLKFYWSGTLAEYNALTYEEKHDGSLHCIYEE